MNWHLPSPHNFSPSTIAPSSQNVHFWVELQMLKTPKRKAQNRNQLLLLLYTTGYNIIPFPFCSFHMIPCSAFDAITVQYIKLLHSQGINHERAALKLTLRLHENLYPSKKKNLKCIHHSSFNSSFFFCYFRWFLKNYCV